MMTTRIPRNVWQTAAMVAVLSMIPWLAAGCDSGLLGGGGGGTGGQNGAPADDDDTDAGATAGEIVSLPGDLPVSGSQPLTILYTTPATASAVEAFYVAEANKDDPLARVPFVFATPLAAGSSQFNIDAADLPRGRYLIGVSYVTTLGVQEVAMSKGALIVEGLPEPSFFAPSDNATVVAGADVQVSVDLGDPEADAFWRLFYISEATAPVLSDIDPEQIPQLGTELASGPGNAISFSWATSTVPVGTYLLGVSATDSGFSISKTIEDRKDYDQVITVYSDAVIEVIDEEPEPPPPPSVVVTAPEANASVFLSGSVDIEFVIDLTDQSFTGLTVFYDDDTSFDNGILGEIATDLGADDTSATWTLSNDITEGGYTLGVELKYGESGSAVSYAAGTVEWVTTPTLQVTAPTTTVITRPGKDVAISWTTNVPPDVAQTQVFAQRADDSSADAVSIQPLSAEGNTSVVWKPTNLVGRYAIWVRLQFNDESLTDLLATAAGFVRISTAPQIVWVGSFADQDENEESGGAIFGGVQFEDNLGSSFTAAGDLDSDGADDFVMSARFGKPDFTNPEGIGHGEAYIVYGSRDRYSGVMNVNSVGTSSLRGVTFTGIRTRQDNTETDGLSDITSIPDVDGDDLPELVFGFPYVESRGHNVDPDQDGVVSAESLGSLERPNQFTRGGIVIVSSTNSVLKNPDSGTPVINLDLVGQRFDEMCVQLEAGQEGNFDWVLDIFDSEGDPACGGSCEAPSTDGDPDATDINWGFSAALSEDYFSAMRGTGCLVQYGFHLNTCDYDYCAGTGPGYCLPEGPNLHGHIRAADTDGRLEGYSGYYPDRIFALDEDDPDFNPEDFGDNEAREPYGARIIGVGVEDGFGTSLTLSDPLDDDEDAGSIIVSAPNRTARGLLFQVGQNWEADWPETGGEIAGLERPAGTPATNADSGVAYMFDLRSLWTESGNALPPKPHQYIVGEGSHCGAPTGAPGRIANVAATRIAGAANEKIQNILGIKDFNGDGRNDFAVGAPTADGGGGRVYIAFRREEAVEGDYVLEKLELSTSDAERLDGALIKGGTGSQFATGMATDIDLNGDEVPDLIVSAPTASGTGGSNVGEVAIIFSSPTLVTPQGGTTIDELVTQGRAAKIVGRDSGDYFGFNIANAGDIDGDGKNDLLVAAPGASPRYDSNINDDDDTLDAFGLDLDGDGQLDNVTGPNGVPEDTEAGEANDNSLDELRQAGLVYVIWGSNVLEGETNVADLGATGLEGAIIVGRRGADTNANPSHPGDFFGGGDAGDSTFGGISAKQDRGRSFGLRSAGDVDGDGLADFLVGSVTATPRIDPQTGEGATHAGEAYLIYGFER